MGKFLTAAFVVCSLMFVAPSAQAGWFGWGDDDKPETGKGLQPNTVSLDLTLGGFGAKGSVTLSNNGDVPFGVSGAFGVTNRDGAFCKSFWNPIWDTGIPLGNKNGKPVSLDFDKIPVVREVLEVVIRCGKGLF